MSFKHLARNWIAQATAQDELAAELNRRNEVHMKKKTVEAPPVEPVEQVQHTEVHQFGFLVKLVTAGFNNEYVQIEERSGNVTRIPIETENPIETVVRIEEVIRLAFHAMVKELKI